MKNKILILVAFLMVSVSALYAQYDVTEQDVITECKKPKKGSFTVGLLLGRGHFINTNLTVGTPVSGAAPYVRSIDANDNSFVNMVGIEGKYFVTNKMAVTLRGGAILRHTPNRLNIPGVKGADGTMVVPAYKAIKGQDNVEVHVAPGLQWYLNLKSARLQPYVGFAIPMDYARETLYDPTVEVRNGVVTKYSYGASNADLFGFGAQGVAGLDYFLTKELFIGFEVNPVSVQYVFMGKKPQPGTILRESENLTYSFFGQFAFKLGFKLN